MTNGKGPDLSVFTETVVAKVFRRDRGRCANCSRQWERHQDRGEPWGWDMQHRMARGQGGARRNPAIGDVANAVILCRSCHDRFEKRERALGFDLGFVISRNGIRQPWEVPIRHAVHGWCRLTQKGGHEACEPPDE